MRGERVGVWGGVGIEQDGRGEEGRRRGRKEGGDYKGGERRRIVREGIGVERRKEEWVARGREKDLEKGEKGRKRRKICKRKKEKIS